MLTEAIEVMKYIRASAGRAGLNVVFEPINQPRHDGDTIYLPEITVHTTKRQLQQLMASTDHEVAHDRYSSFDVLKKIKIDPNSLLMFTWNFLEDSRVNTIEALEYQGFKENWDDCSAELVEDILKKTATTDTLPAKLMTAMLIWESKISVGIFPQIEFVTSKYSCNEEFLDVLNNFTDRLIDCHKILDKVKGTEATYKLAYDILTQLSKECKEELEQALAKADAAKESDEGDKGKSSKPAKDPGTPSDTSGKAKEGAPTRTDEYKVINIEVTEEDLKSMSLSMHSTEGTEMSKTGVNFKPLPDSKGTWALTDFDKFIVVDYPKELGDSKYFQYNWSQEGWLKDYQHRVGKHLVTQENFAQQVRRLIQIRSRVQTQYGTKKGKLDQSRLSRVCFNAPGLNERIFKTRIENTTLDAAMSVLIDMSGSMGGDKVYYALASALLLNEVCSTLNIPVELVGFSDDFCPCGEESVPTMFIYKSFADIKVSPDSIKKSFSQSASYMIGNPDGENILWMHNRLIKRKERKKLLIVLSDGSPAASKDSTGLAKFTKQIIQEIEASKRVDIYGLGLLSPAVEYFYKSHSVVNEVQKIPSKLLELIERKIINV